MVTGGNLVYALGDEEGPEEEYSEKIPKAISIGTYYVWYKADGDENHRDTAEDSIKASIVEDIGVHTLWNLYEDNLTHSFKINGITSDKTVENTDKNSSKYYIANLSGDVIEVKLRDNADRKKAAKNNTFSFVLNDGRCVSYLLPMAYNKPVLKLSSSKGKVYEGKNRILTTTVLIKTENGNFKPYDIKNASLSLDSNKASEGSLPVEAGEDGQVKITAYGKFSGKLSITEFGWYDKDPIKLSYSISETKKDFIEVDMGDMKKVILNTNAPGQRLDFPVLLNGESAEDGEFTIEGNGRDFGSIEDGILSLSLGRSDVKKGNYTLTLVKNKTKFNIKIRVSDKKLDESVSGKVKLKYDIFTEDPMVVTPNLKEVSGAIMAAKVLSPEGYKAEIEGENINIYCTDDAVASRVAKDQTIGDMRIALYLEGMDHQSEVPVITLKKVKAGKSTPAIKSVKVVIPNNAPDDGKTVIAAANIISTCKDRSGNIRNIINVEGVTLENNGVLAEVDKDDNQRILIRGLDKKSGTIKATVTYIGGLKKKITINVSRGNIH